MASHTARTMGILRVTASSQTLTLRSSVRLMTASRRTTEAPPRRSSRQGRISERPQAPGISDSTAPFAADCQSFLGVLRQFTLADLLRAGDRFDSDCVVGTQFESSQPHHAVPYKQRFPGVVQIAPNWCYNCCSPMAGLSLTARSSAQAKTALARGNKDTPLQKTALCLWSHPFSDSPHYVQREEMRHDHLPA
jgi:hypothetical protein